MNYYYLFRGQFSTTRAAGTFQSTIKATIILSGAPNFFNICFSKSGQLLKDQYLFVHINNL